MALPAFAAERRAAIDLYLLSAGPTAVAAVRQGQTDGQTDGPPTDA